MKSTKEEIAKFIHTGCELYVGIVKTIFWGAYVPYQPWLWIFN